MFTTLPTDARAALDWTWERFAPYFEDLERRPLAAGTLEAWMADWSRLSDLMSEAGARLNLAYDLDTADADAEARYFRYLETIVPPAEAADHRLKAKLIASGLTPEGMAVPLRDLRASVALFREANLPLLVEAHKLGAEYDKRVGAQTVAWEGREVPIPQLRPVLEDPDRARREQAWRLIAARRLADRAVIDDLWRALLDLRGRIATNAGHPDYRSYLWQAYRRFDYTPDDCASFHRAIETVCVPAAARLYERHRRRLGVPALRPWDLTDGTWGRPAGPPGKAPLRPYRRGDELLAKGAALFRRVDARLGDEFGTLLAENLLDVDNRAGKAPGGYCTYFATARRPFIFMNAVGVHDDVQTLLHEAGHAFHALAKADLPYHPQRHVPMEFNEVASMAMELLGAPYLSANGDGFYTDADADRARVEHLESMIYFWPYMAVVDAFQHWAYTHAAEAADPAACDARWRALYTRFFPAIDWTDLDAELETGWQRRLHIFRVPLYYVEYGLAALGAAQVWRGALADPGAAMARYRAALALGGTATLPELYAAAGARFALDAGTLGEVVALIEGTIGAIEGAGGWSGEHGPVGGGAGVNASTGTPSVEPAAAVPQPPRTA